MSRNKIAITSIVQGKTKTMITVSQFGRSVTLHLVNNVDKYGRRWFFMADSFESPQVNLDLVDPRQAPVAEPESAESAA